MKRYPCYICKENKQAACFYKDAGRTTGLSSACKSCQHGRARDWRKNDAQKRRDHPNRVRARNKLQQAVFHGKIRRQPCEVCGAPNAQGHHDNYDKPLDVRWLCQKHHAKVHFTPLQEEE